MPTALVVDDSKVDQRLVVALLEKHPNLTVLCAGNGREALEVVGRHTPDLLLTDMIMPEMGGLELVERIRRQHPAIPIIVMTAHGSEDAAAEALRRGATSYVPKKYLARDLLETIDRVLGVAGVAGAAIHGAPGASGEAGVTPPGNVETPNPQPGPDSAAQAARYLQTVSFRFVVDDNPPHLDPLVRYVEREVARMELFDDAGMMRLGIALSEALANAVNHGNLAVGSELRESDMSAYYRLIDERRATPPYRDRKVYVSTEVTRSRVVLVVGDEGAGFDPHSLPDPTDPARLEKTSGRGMLLIRTFMDEVRHNSTGNEITMVKYKGRDDPGG